MFFGLVSASGGVVVGLLADGGVTVESGFVVEFGTVLGMADGEFGAAVGVFGAALGVFGAASGVALGALGVTLGVAPGSVEGFVLSGVALCVSVVLCDFCGLIVLCELGLLD